VDHNPHGRGRATYYVVAQDASGNMSAPSNVATDQVVSHLPTFRYMAGVLEYWAQHGKITSAQALSTIQALQSAYAHLQAGDGQGGYNQVEALRQQFMNSAQTPNDRLRAEITGFLLKRLEKRIMLVNAHVLPLSKIS
jgi:hypothetical protein